MRLPIRLAAAALIVGSMSFAFTAPAVAGCNESILTGNLVPLGPGSQIMVHQQYSVGYSGWTCVLYNIWW